MLPQPYTEVAFLPLVDRPPVHPDTIKTAIERGLSLARAVGDDVSIFTADQQLYQVTLGILFHGPSYFKSVIAVLGVMLMNFINATAIIMDGSGLIESLAGIFGNVNKTLNGKNYPQNFRAPRMLVQELLRDVVQEPGVISFTRLIEVLEMWNDNLVKTVIIMRNFSRAGYEGDWALHLFASEAILPYFRFAGCHNYARYGAFYVHKMKASIRR